MPSPGFWANEARLMAKVVFPLVTEAVQASAEGAIAQLEIEGGVDWALINEEVAALAQTITFDLVNGLTANTAAMVNDVLEAWVASGEPLDSLAAALEPTFGASRARSIAVTEVTRVFAKGNIMAWIVSGVVSAIKWMTAEDDLVCPICEPLGDLDPVPLEGGSFQGQEHPPAHVHCRCWLQPVVSVAKFIAKFGRKPSKRLLQVA